MNSAASSIVLNDQDHRVEVSGYVLTKTFRPPGLVLPSHFHEHANIGLTVDGCFTETVGTTAHELNPSCVVFRPAGEKHFNRYGKAAARCLIIEVKPERLAGIRQVTQILDRASCIKADLVSTLALRIFHESRMRDTVAPLSIEALTLELLVHAARLQCVRDQSPPLWLRQAREALHEQFAESISLSSIAESVGVHAAHVAKMFRRHYGCTVGDYVRRLRLDYAARLLVQSDRNLSTIALLAGFYDQSHFTQLFKLRFGVTPGGFRAGLDRKRVHKRLNRQNLQD
jgi:AraC family transcriptional regulator